MKKEHNKHASISDENLAVALAKLAAAKNKMSRETLQREHLQATVVRLEQQLISERRRISSEHQDEVKQLKATWGDEKKRLLDVIQRDCNIVFDEQRSESVLEMSPRSVDYDFSKSKEIIANAPDSQNTAGLEKHKSLVYSPKMDAELRETEALVQKLLVGKMQDGEE